MAGGPTHPYVAALTAAQDKPASEKLLVKACARHIEHLYPRRSWWISTDAAARQNRRGLPDWILILDGIPYVWEYKHPRTGGRMQPRQQTELDLAQRAGARTAIIRSVSQALTILLENHEPT